MRRYIPLFVALTAVVIFSNVSSAVITTTDPVGFTTTSLPGSSDTYVSIPFTRPPEFIGAIQSIAGNVITVSGTPGWTTNQFAGTQKYYALIGTSTAADPKEGHTYAVTTNASNTVTVDTTQDDLTGVPVSPATTQLILIPNWTLKTIFPSTDQNVSFTPTTLPPTYKTLIRVPDYSAAGIDLPYAAEYYFNNSAWRRISDGADHGDDPLLPDGYFVVRNANGAPTLPLTALGAVLLKKLATPLIVQTGQAQDNPVSLLRPLDVALNATGLGPAFASGDQLLLFNNAQIAIDKSPSATYFYNTRWRLSGDATNADRGADVIPTGTGFLVRKAASNNGDVSWTNAFPVTAISAVSRKSHGGVAGSPFDLSLPLSGTPGVECRSPGGTPGGVGIDYQIVFTFPTTVSINTGAGTQGAAVTSGIGSVASTSGNTTSAVTVNLTGVTDIQRITVTLLGVNDGTNANDVGVRMGLLTGDVNGSGVVTSGDTNLCKAQALQAVTTLNFRNDINGSGAITSGDANLVKQNALHQLPPP